MRHLGRVPVVRETFRGALEQPGPARPASSAVPSPRWNSARLHCSPPPSAPDGPLSPSDAPTGPRRAFACSSSRALLHPAPSAALRPPFGQRGRMSRTPLPEHQPEHAQYDHQRVQHEPPPLPEPDQSILRGQDGCRRPAGPQSIPTLRREPAQMTTQCARSDCEPLAGKSTLNRMELSANGRDPAKARQITVDFDALDELLVELYLVWGERG